MNALPQITTMVDEYEADSGLGSGEESRKQFSSLQRVITISYDNLNRLRHETSSSFVREEIKTLEGKLVRLFYRQMSLHDGHLEPDMNLWLHVVGLSDQTVEGLLDRKMKLRDSVEHIESVKAAMKQLRASDEDVRRLSMALHNIRIYQERCQACECGKQAQWQDLHWESWGASKNHGSISSSGTVNSGYYSYSDANYGYRHSSDGAMHVHRPNNLSYSDTPPLRHMSDSVGPVCVFRKRSDSSGCPILPWESDGACSTPSSPSFLEGPLSYSNLSVHAVINSRHMKPSLQRSNTVSLVTPITNKPPLIASAQPLRASIHSLPIRKSRKWYTLKKGKRPSRTDTSSNSNSTSSRNQSLRSSVDYDRNPHCIDAHGFDIRVKAHRVHHAKSIVPKVCCLCSRSIFYGLKCSDCGARYHEACYYQAGASFRAVHPEVHVKRESWILRFFRRSSTESQALSSSSDSGLCMPGLEKRKPSLYSSISSLSGCRSGSSTASTPGSNTSHFFSGNHSNLVELHSNSIHITAKRSNEAKVSHVHVNGSMSLPSQWTGSESEAQAAAAVAAGLQGSFACRHSSVISDVPEETSATSSRAHLPHTLSMMSTSSTINGNTEGNLQGLDSTVSTLSESCQSTFNDETTLYGSEVSANGDLVSSSGSEQGSRRFRAMRGSLVTEWEIRMDEIDMSDKLPAGRFGTVFKGNWHGECAVRLFRKDDATHDDVVAFRKEVQLMKKTRHENIALFMAAVVKPPNLALVTAFIKGKSLHQLIHLEGERFAAEATRPIAKQITQGMAYLHARGIVHRDLRSRNVFVDGTGHIVISDFAMSAVLLSCDRKENKLRLEKYGLELRRGYLQYLAPELIKQLDVCDPHLTRLTFNQSTDVFAFATVIYECIQGWPCTHRDVHTQIYLFGNCRHADGVASIVTEFRDMIVRAWSPSAADRLNFTYYEELIGRFPRKLHQMSRGPSFPMVCMEAYF